MPPALNMHGRMGWEQHVEWFFRLCCPHSSPFFEKGMDQPPKACKWEDLARQAAIFGNRAGKTISTLRFNFTPYQLSYWQASIRLKRTCRHGARFIGKTLLAIWEATCGGKPRG